MIKYLDKLIYILIICLLYYIYQLIFPSETNIKLNFNDYIYRIAKTSHDFVFNAHFGILTNIIPTTIEEHPEISVVIPIFNIEKLINRSILSVQNQNFKNFEIILINDFSTDNTYNIVKELSQKDKRIKVINNIIKRGTLYSRCIGTLISKGKYIFPLDSDDLYLINDTFTSVYTKAKKNNPDLIIFQGISVLDINDFFNLEKIKSFRNFQSNRFLFQPAIARDSYDVCSLQAYCINSSFYKNVINFYGKKRWSEFITYREDCIINFIIHQLAKSCLLFLKFGYLHIFRASSNSHTEVTLNRTKYDIYYLEVKYHYSIIPFHKIKAVEDLINLQRRKYFDQLLKDNKTTKFLKSFVNKIILNISDLDKYNNSIKVRITNFSKTFLNLSCI